MSCSNGGKALGEEEVQVLLAAGLPSYEKSGSLGLEGGAVTREQVHQRMYIRIPAVDS